MVLVVIVKCSCLHCELHAAAEVVICLQYCKCLVQQRCGLRFSFFMESMSLDTNHLITVIYDLIGKQTKPVRFYQACTNSSWYNWRASEASETLLVVVQWKTRYVYTYIYIYRYVRHTLVARSWGDVMWEELSVSHF